MSQQADAAGDRAATTSDCSPAGVATSGCRGGAAGDVIVADEVPQDLLVSEYLRLYGAIAITMGGSGDTSVPGKRLSDSKWAGPT